MSGMDKAMADLHQAAAAAGAINAGGAKTAIVDATRALKRIVQRGETLPAEWERVEVKQFHGPTIEFTGRKLCSDEAKTRGRPIEMELWETRGGAMVAVTRSWPERDDVADERATIVPPGDDERERRFAVADAFDWHPAARQMLRRRLDWTLRIEVE